MTNAFILVIVFSCIPACHAITSAHRAGARGWLACAVWIVEEAGERLLRLGAFLRDFDAWYQSRKLVYRGQRNAGNWSPAVRAASSANSPAVGESSSLAAGSMGGR